MSPSPMRQDLLTDQYRTGENLNARIALHERFSTSPLDWHGWVFDLLPSGGAPRILELGCGTAQLWRTNRDRIPSDWAVVLSDRSPGMCREAREHLRGSGLPFSFAAVDAQLIPFADASFHVVIANHMLYHVPDRPRTFAEVRRVLHPGGRFFAATNGTDHMRELDELARRFDPALANAFGQLGFHLDNGAAELAPWFADVALHRFEDSLVVTEATPLVDYILSTTRVAGLTPLPEGWELRARLTAFVEDVLQVRGAFHVTKPIGLFEAWN